MQPILDAITYWQTELELELSFSFLPRTLLMLAAALLGFLISERKRLYFVAAGLLAAFWAAHMLVCRANGYLSMAEDLANYVRILSLPVFTLALISFVRSSDSSFVALKKGLALSFAVTVVLAVIAILTGTEPFTYHDKQEGIRGWCIWPNTQSAIVCMLVPLFIFFVQDKYKKPCLTAIAVTIGLACLFFHGTRLAFAAMVVTGLFFAISVFIFPSIFHSKRLGIFLLAVTLAFTACLPISPMYRNQQKVSDNVAIRESMFDTLLAQGEAEAKAEGLSGKEYELRRLEPVYSYYLTDFVETFGMEETAEAYGYCDEYSVIPGLRDYKLRFCKQLMKHSVSATKFFGLEITRMFVGNGFDVENDFHAQWYLFGWVGLVGIILFILYFVIRTLRALITMKKAFPFFPVLCFYCSLGMCLVHSYCTCGVLRRSNALFFMAAILTGIYNLTETKKLHQK